MRVTLLTLLVALISSQAYAQSSPYCLKSRARSHAEAALLFAPRIHVQALRYPSGFEMGPTLNGRVQLRVGGSWSPLDMWQGLRLLEAGTADCSLHNVDTEAERVVRYAPEALLVAAYRAQASSLASSHGERETLEKRAEQRLRDNVITVLEFRDFEQVVMALNKRQEEVVGIVGRLKAEGIESPPSNLNVLAREHVEKSDALEKKEAAVRAFAPWTLRLSGGLIPAVDREVDWYGWLALSYSLGGPAYVRHERRHRAARAEEVRTARYELGPRMDMLRRQIDARVAQARKELALVERQLAFIDTTLRSLGVSELANISHARDSLTLERFLAESEHAFLLALLETLSPLGGESHASGT